MRISDWSSDVCSSDLQPISSRAISKIRNDECGQRYAAEQLAAAGARTRRSGENGAHWLADLERSGFLRRQKHPGNHVYLFPLTKAARIAAGAVPRLPDPVKIGRAACRARGCIYGKYA